MIIEPLAHILFLFVFGKYAENYICDRVRENQPYVGEIDFEIRGPTANSG